MRPAARDSLDGLAGASGSTSDVFGTVLGVVVVGVDDPRKRSEGNFIAFVFLYMDIDMVKWSRLRMVMWWAAR